MMNDQSKYAIILVSVFSFLLSSCGAGQILGPTNTPIPTITNTSTPTFIPTKTSTPTETPIPLPPWAKALPKGTTIEISPSGNINITSLSWLNDIGVDKNQYDISFDSENLTINAYEINSSQDELKPPIFQATFDAEKMIWNGKFWANFAIAQLRNDCESTTYKPSEYWLANSKDKIDYNTVKGFPDQVQEYILALFKEQKENHKSDYPDTVTYYFVLIDRNNGCWGANDGNFLSYRNKNGDAKWISIMPLSPEESMELFFNPVP